MLAAGFLFGLAVAAPVGPVALLCIRRTLGRGWASGLVSGLGVGTADAAYAAVAATGVGLAAVLLGPASRWLQLAGAAAIALIGFRTVRSAPPTPAEAPVSAGGLARDYGSIVAITLANPPTILSFVALAAALAPAREGGAPSVALLVLGVFLGSAAWWTLLTGVVAAARTRLRPSLLAGITRASGAGLIAFGIAASAAALR